MQDNENLEIEQTDKEEVPVEETMLDNNQDEEVILGEPVEEDAVDGQLEYNQIEEDNVEPEEEDDNDEVPPSPSVHKEKKNSFFNYFIIAGLFLCAGFLAGLLFTANRTNNNPLKNMGILYYKDPQTFSNIDKKHNDNNMSLASQIYYENIDSVVAINTEFVTRNIFGQRISAAAAGSGFVVSENGHILTNYHVIEGTNTINVAFVDGSIYTAEVIGFEKDSDIALLKIDATKKLKPVKFGNSENTLVGEQVFAIGNPLGELTFSITGGYVSAMNREIQTGSMSSLNMFQVDCAINEGNSGGPIFNSNGEVIGIATAKYASEIIEGLGFCIPIDDAVLILNDLLEYGKVMNKAYMGIQVSDVSSVLIEQYNMKAGAYVQSVDAGSCAEKAGLKIGDIIVKMGDKNVLNTGSLLSAKRNYRAGDTVSLTVYRSGEYIDMEITFDEAPEVEETEVETEGTPSTEELLEFYEYFKDMYPYFGFED